MTDATFTGNPNGNGNGNGNGYQEEVILLPPARREARRECSRTSRSTPPWVLSPILPLPPVLELEAEEEVRGRSSPLLNLLENESPPILTFMSPQRPKCLLKESASSPSLEPVISNQRVRKLTGP